MSARSSKLLVSGVALATAAVLALIVGTACNHGPDSCSCDVDTFAGDAMGARVVPPAPDTTPGATVTFNTTTLAYTYTVTTQSPGTIDSIALYQVAYGDPLPSSATAILCAGAAACASTRKAWSTVIGGSGSGTATLVPPATAATIKTSMRGYGTQLVFFTTTAQEAAGGAMRGTMYPDPFSRCPC